MNSIPNLVYTHNACMNCWSDTVAIVSCLWIVEVFSLHVIVDAAVRSGVLTVLLHYQFFDRISETEREKNWCCVPITFVKLKVHSLGEGCCCSNSSPCTVGYRHVFVAGLVYVVDIDITNLL